MPTGAARGEHGDPSPDALAVSVARQPIVDARMRLVGYELLYRDGRSATAEVTDHDAATYQVATRLVLDIGFDALVGSHFAAINAAGGFLAEEGYRVLPAERTVVELLEHVTVDDTVVRQVETARDLGYRVALDDYTGPSSHDRLGTMVSIVKLDVRAVPPADLAGVVAHVRGIAPDAQLLAEKVETVEDVERCRALGCGLFQGYLVGRPELRSGTRVQANGVAAVRLIADLQDPQASVRELTATIERDPVLSYRMLVLVNSAGWGLTHRVASVRRALVLVGLDTARRLATVLALTVLSGSSGYLAEHLAVRAKVCEAIAGSAMTGVDPGEAFTVGLFSGLDALLGAPLEDVLAGVELATPVRDALLGRRGPLGTLLSSALAYEQGRVGDLVGGVAAWTAAWRSATEWAGDLRSEFGT